MSNELWSIYLAGPDDLVAMPSKPVAEAVARNFNAVWERYGAERGHDVHAVAHVEPWMHGMEAHAKDLREHFHEYADLVLDEDAARFKPAQPIEAVNVTSLRGALEAIAERHSEKSVDGQIARAALAHPRPTDGVALTPEEVEWVEFAIAHAHDDAEPEDIQCASVLQKLLDRSAPTGEQAGEVMDARTALTILGQRMAEASPSLPRPSWISTHKAEFWTAGIESMITRALAEIAMLDRELRDSQRDRNAQPRPMGLPDGWKLVPVDPTVAMLAEGRSENLCCNDDADRIYKAMLAAAPVAGGG